MATYILLITLLSHGSSGTIATSSMAPSFSSKELGEAARADYVSEAGTHGGWFSGKPEVMAVCVRAS